MVGGVGMDEAVWGWFLALSLPHYEFPVASSSYIHVSGRPMERGRSDQTKML